ncbi:Lrp/AsnC family transcriptional regulator [Paenibacillus sp. 1011MAR3C5]|uniref:Lrp/AsnC family transcriptional regulator n=1 Tax=Paenibacillus sp. 1011MAR3C5 TaxID=1675787 RepID=UPI000E6B9839|nr:Lrp/AsnC family transcriptional regulator [Paenibacillus sp. 1011MAR3C5]RJE86125.1 Lrp/AsnC family transcriptional regulator [Paenibacillus sp. 1011MAR3C5]
MLDKTDYAILACLQSNARMQMKEIGERVHMTGQAVANRIARLEELGVLLGYTVKLDESKLEKPFEAMVTVFLTSTSNSHAAFRKWALNEPAITELHRVTGDGCYWLKVRYSDPAGLSVFLEDMLRFGNYRVNNSLEKLK